MEWGGGKSERVKREGMRERESERKRKRGREGKRERERRKEKKDEKVKEKNKREERECTIKSSEVALVFGTYDTQQNALSLGHLSMVVSVTAVN